MELNVLEPPLLTPVLWLSASALRSSLVQSITSSNVSTYYGINVNLGTFPDNLVSYPRNRKFVHACALIYVQSAYLAQREIVSDRTISAKSHQKRCETLMAAINHDLKRVSLHTALAAWLTTDEWRWHTTGQAPHVPEDLYYGLVLEYPNAVLRHAQYFLFPEQRRELVKLLTPFALEQSFSEAVRIVKTVFNEKSEVGLLFDSDVYDG